MIPPDTILALSRFGFYVAATLLFGAQCFVAFLAPEPLGAVLATAARRGLKAASVVAMLACLLALPAVAAMIGGGWSMAFDGGTLKALLLSTTIGRALLVRAALSLAVMAVFLGCAGAERLKAAIAALLLASLGLSGHARMEEGAREAIHLANHSLHLLAAGFWLGSLAILPACLARLSDPALGRQASAALRRFSSSGHLAVALVIATGIVNAALILGGWPDGQALYQWLLLAKIVLVATMAGLAIVNRYVFVPSMRSQPDNAIVSIRHGTYAELVLGGAVLALVAVFGLMEPN